MIHKSFDAKYLTYLARFIRKRDKEAFAELYNYTHKKIDQYALQFLKDPHLAQDAVQEIYILIYKNIDSLRRRFTLFVMDEPDHLPCLLRFSPQGTQPVI